MENSKTIEIKEEFFEQLPFDVINKFKKIDLDILDESIENVLDGTSTINGKIAETKQERFILIASHYSHARNILNGIINGTSKTYPKSTLNINYRGTTHTYEFPAPAKLHFVGR